MYTDHFSQKCTLCYTVGTKDITNIYLLIKYNLVSISLYCVIVCLGEHSCKDCTWQMHVDLLCCEK